MSLLLTARIWLWRAGPALVVVSLAAAGLWAAQLATAPEPAGTAVQVASAQLAAGAVLTAADLRTVVLAPGQAPSGAPVDATTLLGKTLAVPVPPGLPVVPELLTGDRFALDPPDGTSVVPLDLPEAAVLRLGDRVDVLPAGCPEQSEPLAEGALVVELADQADLETGPVLVAVEPAEARALASVRDVCPMAAVLVE